MSIGFSGPLPPERFNMARYCLDISAPREANALGLLVLGGEDTSPLTEQWSYDALHSAVSRIAGGLLADGHDRGDRIGIRLGNTSEYALLFFAAIKAGCVAVPTSGQLTDREIDLIANDAGIKENAFISTTQVKTWIDNANESDWADTQADHPAFLIYTSGTTGKPKGVLHGHRSAWGRRPMYQDWYGITSSDRVFHAGAFNWTYTLGTGLTDPWANAATAIVNTRPRTPALWPELIRHTEATIFAAVPSLYRQILKYAPPGPIDVGALRHGLTAGETLPETVATEWYKRTGTRLHEALGMSEISTYISSAPHQPAPTGTVGRAQSGRSIAILPTGGGTTPLPTDEVGLLAIHQTDPGLMLDYWNRPTETAKVFRGDWFIGGDLASISSCGNVTHHGRADDLMNALGYRVSPLEVEQVLGQVPGVNEVAVTDITVREGVTIIAAFVVAAHPSASLQEILDHQADKHLAAYKRPREYVFVDTLPRTPNGKVRRSDLQSMFDHQDTST